MTFFVSVDQQELQELRNYFVSSDFGSEVEKGHLVCTTV